MISFCSSLRVSLFTKLAVVVSNIDDFVFTNQKIADSLPWFRLKCY